MRFKTHVPTEETTPGEETPGVERPRREGMSPTRRRVYGLVAVVLAAGWLIAGAPVPTFSPTTQVEAGVAAARTVDDPVARLSEALTAARQTYAAKREFTGFTYPGTLTAALGDTVLIAAAGSDGTCVYTGIVDGTANGILTDPTGAACDPQTLEEAQAALEARDDRVAQAEASVIGDRIRQVVESAAMWSQITFTEGRPSLTGLADQLTVADTTVVDTAPDGSSITVEVVYGSSCTLATVTAGAAPIVTTSNC